MRMEILMNVGQWIQRKGTREKRENPFRNLASLEIPFELISLNFIINFHSSHDELEQEQ